MNLADILDSRSILPNVKAQNKKQLLQDLAHAASDFTGLASNAILETLVRREALGSTGLGQGVAIPHGKIRDLGQVYGLFARLAAPIEFDAVDNEPVDLVFLLLAPEHAGADHLKALARISRLLREPSSIERLRASKDRATLYSVLTEPVVHAA